ncbi:hypothetical protein P256_02146 [Acinetobacter nectaris CIP 110549]|uniref:Fe-S protein n=1 Tax=Acinetobacter nectaris CIP 110549 TaxID=1392540 RepID=V2T5K5_9GAMM|nr:DUF1289 domain-containing protein [Acinetobacter nectaris]ESK37713.1 hypothetical protein P256_02146 [Acinetobacter nectaris CIP 110549]
MSNEHHTPALTPCAGRCSTVFGDHVCRGCRRFNHEVIKWNNYTAKQQLAVWKRLDEQLDKVLIPLLPHMNLEQVNLFLERKGIRLLPEATLGRRLYHALKLCEKNKKFSEESGLGISTNQVKPLWDNFENRILTLANASYELAWIRANSIGKNLIKMLEEE